MSNNINDLTLFGSESKNISEQKLPYHRMWKPMRESPNSGNSQYAYLNDHRYAINPQAYTRTFLYLQKDIHELFEYIEPSDANLNTFSHRILQLLIRCCVEIEANFKAIFKENIYNGNENRWNINDYKLIIKSHHLDGYTVKFPIWDGQQNSVKPFDEWRESEKITLKWYDAYNKVKHNRQNNIHKASFQNLLHSYAALFVLLSAQFGSHSYEPGPVSIVTTDEDSYYKEFEFGIGDYLGIITPTDWQEEEKYDFEWNQIKDLTTPFYCYDYNALRIKEYGE